VAAAVLGVLGAVSIQANVVQLSFSGTYDTHGGTIFGLSGPAVPFSYELTYDTSLDTNPLFFPIGASLGGDTTAHPWYGYSASGITATSLTFGTQTWTVADLQPRNPAVGVSADLWFDTDLSVAAPTRCWMEFDQSLRYLTIGQGASASGCIFMLPSSDLSDFAAGPMPVDSSDLSIQVVPEPGTLALLAVGGLGLLLRIKPR
jgi:hypothetical protein